MSFNEDVYGEGNAIEVVVRLQAKAIADFVGLK